MIIPSLLGPSPAGWVATIALFAVWFALVGWIAALVGFCLDWML